MCSCCEPGYGGVCAHLASLSCSSLLCTRGEPTELVTSTKVPLKSRDAEDQTRDEKLQKGCQDSLLKDDKDNCVDEDKPVYTTVQKTITLVGVLYNAFLTLGLPFSFSTFFTDLLEIFGSTRWEASLVQSMFIGVTTGAGIPVGFLLHRFGVRSTMAAGSVLSFLGMFCSWFATSLVHLIITVGVITGFGGCMVYVTSTVIVSATFQKKKGFAMTAITAMAGFGPVILPKIMEALMTSYGLRGTLLIFSGLYLNMVVATIVVTPSHRQTMFKPDSNESFTVKVKRLLHPVFVSYCFSSMTTIGCMNGVFVIIVDFCLLKGISKQDSIDFLLIINALVGIGGIMAGFLKLIPRVHGAVVYCVFSCVCALGTMFLPIAEGYGAILACLCTYGIGQGAYNGIQMVGVLDIVGHEMLPFGMGVRGILVTIGNPVGAVLTGWLYDQTRSYDLPFRVDAGAAIGASIVTLIVIGIYSCCRATRGHHIH